jgi:hypothetical protein
MSKLLNSSSSRLRAFTYILFPSFVILIFGMLLNMVEDIILGPRSRALKPHVPSAPKPRIQWTETPVLGAGGLPPPAMTYCAAIPDISVLGR